jgi:hypothetical protein
MTGQRDREEAGLARVIFFGGPEGEERDSGGGVQAEHPYHGALGGHGGGPRGGGL